MDGIFNRFADKRIAFIGTGVSHNDLIRLFLSEGMRITVCDKKLAEELGELYDEFKALGAEFMLGEGYLDMLSMFDIVFRTPGMYYNHPALVSARERGVAVTSETEVFFELCPCKIYAVTGSDGKTTTTTLISEILQNAGFTVHKGGNIGRALLPLIREIKPEDVAVVELSSFQLISMRSSPDVAVVTNIAPNHLDVHGTMAEYIDAKRNIFAHQGAFSKTVLNQDNELTNAFSPVIRGALVKFSVKSMPDCGAYLDEDGVIWYNHYGFTTRIMHKDDIKIPGMHNVENYLAAISAVWEDVSAADITRVAESFGGVEHRIEFVCEKNGVKWYNDSIATSPTRVLAGLKAFGRRLIIIAGGYDKQIPFEPLAEPLNTYAQALILLGPTAEKICSVVVRHPEYCAAALPVYMADDMEAAVAKAAEIAKQGDIVTLSPACASFDAYPNFEARGRHFKDLVNKL